MKIHFNLAMILLCSSLMVGFSCKEDVVPCEYDGCDPKRPTVKVAKDVNGRVSVLDKKHPNLWVIVSAEGIIGQEGPAFDGPDVVVPCNLPDNFKEQGLRVVFSGALKDPCGDFNGFNSAIYYSDLTDVREVEDD